jgi:hypothetical protein
MTELMIKAIEVETVHTMLNEMLNAANYNGVVVKYLCIKYAQLLQEYDNLKKD